MTRVWTQRRRAARAVVLDGRDRVLLLRARDPFDSSKGEWWELPGGGVEGTEATADAAAREVFEESGLRDVAMGPCVWTHRARFVFAGMLFDQQEYIHVARWSGADPAPGDYRPGGLEAIEAMAFGGYEWWDPAQLAPLKIIPPWLAHQLPRYLVDGPPAEPHDLGQLPDLF